MAKDQFKWGLAKAKQRYGSAAEKTEGPATGQAPQDSADKHGAKYENDTSGWRHSGGEKRPGFKKGE